MEVDSDNEPLNKVASGEPVEEGSWLDMRADILTRLDKIARNEFPIPKLPPPPPAPSSNRLLSPLPSSPLELGSQETDKENAPVEKPAAEPKEAPEPQELAPGELPKQLDDMLTDIKTHLETFETHAPHTIQRLAEMILHPRAHYKALASYLHAMDRVVRVTSGTDTYPLPPAIPDMSGMDLNGEDGKDPAASVSWSNPTTASLGTDEALGGALLTPIPWLARRSPEESNGEDAAASSNGGAGAQIHSEGSETIDGPNGMGRIETVSVSVNGIPSTGHARGVTQGELLRQEQRAGVVPVNQLSRNQDSMGDDEKERDRDMEGNEEGEEEEEIPHARGPEEIGVGDTGPQGVTTSYMDEDGVQMQGIDVEAAVGRKHEDDAEAADSSAAAEPSSTAGVTSVKEDDAASDSSVESTGTKREAEQDLESETVKKVKEDTGDNDGDIDVGAAEDASSKPDLKDDEAMDEGDAAPDPATDDKSVAKVAQDAVEEPTKDADVKDGADADAPESKDEKMEDGAD